MKKEILSIIVVTLFFGLAIAPSINANVTKQDDLVELDVELCGPGKKHTVKLPGEKVDEITTYLEEVVNQLSGVESEDEAMQIINDAIERLSTYGLLNRLSIKYLEKGKHLNDLLEPDNRNCLIFGFVKGVYLGSLFTFLDENLVTHWNILDGISLILLAITFILGLLNPIPFSFRSIILYVDSFFWHSGETRAGLVNIKATDIAGSLEHYTGIKISFAFRHFLIGFAREVDYPI